MLINARMRKQFCVFLLSSPFLSLHTIPAVIHTINKVMESIVIISTRLVCKKYDNAAVNTPNTATIILYSKNKCIAKSPEKASIKAL